jgi:hypothetical protein
MSCAIRFGDIFFSDMMAWNLMFWLSLTIAFFVLQITFSPRTPMALDADPEEDFYVADLASTTIINGFVCKSTTW